MLGRPVPKGLSIHFTDPFKPSSPEGPPQLGVGLKPGPLPPQGLELVRLGAHMPCSGWGLLLCVPALQNSSSPSN